MNKPLTMHELEVLGASLLKPAALTEIGLILVCLGLAWLIVWRLSNWQKNRGGAAPVLFGRNVIDGVLFPVLALLFVLAVRPLLPRLGVPTAVFRLVLPVLVSLVLIRLTARVMAVALPQSPAVKLIERSVSWLAWIGSILWITGLWPLLMEGLSDISFKIGAAHVTLRDLLEGLVTSVIVLVLALWLSAAIEGRLLRGKAMDLSLRKMAANIVRAVLLFVGLIIALTSAGIDLTALSVLGGAVGVGIGLGLQKLAANYVSGFVILAERSLRIGDMVKVDNFEGRVSDIKTRYTVIRSLGGREAIVPNEMMVTQRVENSSLDDSKVLLNTVVQVEYGCDIDAVMARLTEAAGTPARVLKDPGPSVSLSNFAADGLELTVNFWINDPQNGQGGVRSEVNLAILRTLNAMNVQIPYPQQVQHAAVVPEAPLASAAAAASAPPAAAPGAANADLQR